MGERERLPATRRAITHKGRVGDVEFYITVGCYPDGRPGEIFIKSGDVAGGRADDSKQFQGWLDTIATCISLCLQSGVSVATVCRHLAHRSFEPSGFTDVKEFGHVRSIPDYIAKLLAQSWRDETTCKGCEDKKAEGQP